MNIETKIRNIRFLGELAKFKVAPPGLIFSCLKVFHFPPLSLLFLKKFRFHFLFFSAICEWLILFSACVGLTSLLSFVF
jgi:hypothetical protein